MTLASRSLCLEKDKQNDGSCEEVFRGKVRNEMIAQVCFYLCGVKFYFISSVCDDCIKGCSRVCYLFHLMVYFLFCSGFFFWVARNILVITHKHFLSVNRAVTVVGVQGCGVSPVRNTLTPKDDSSSFSYSTEISIKERAGTVFLQTFWIGLNSMSSRKFTHF